MNEQRNERRRLAYRAKVEELRATDPDTLAVLYEKDRLKTLAYRERVGKEEINAQEQRRVKERQEKLLGPKPLYCSLCLRSDRGRIVFDHSHGTDKARGWLCHNCNVMLGYAEDDPVILQQAIEWLSSKG